MYAIFQYLVYDPKYVYGSVIVLVCVVIFLWIGITQFFPRLWFGEKLMTYDGGLDKILGLQFLFHVALASVALS